MFDQIFLLFTPLVVIGSIYAFYLKFLAPVWYWKLRGVYHINLYYRFLKVFLSDASFLEIIREDYDSFPDRRYYGSYQFFRPSLFVRDVELIKKITVKDFDHFHDHATISNRASDPILTQNLFALKGNAWRNMRATLSPAFTSSKMRQMFTLMAQTAETFTNYVLKDSGDNKYEIEMKDFYSKYANDVIATCAFGIECDSLRNKDNEFYRMGKFFASAFTGIRALKGLLIGFFPWLAKTLKVGLFPETVTDFFKRMVKETIKYREKEGVIRPDLIHLLMQARKGQLKEDGGGDIGNAGYASVEETDTRMDTNGKIELTDDLITAQALVFFFAGFETSSTLLGLVSYELARNPDIQKKLQQEIDDTLEVTNGKLDYDAISTMKYLDQVVSEALRLYPPGIALSRVCTKDYPVPATRANEKNFVLEKDCLLAIPVYGIHMCPDFFPNPGKFDPDRFSEANKANIIAGTYMPFGSGPRNCIGSRFALLETKALIVSLLSKLNLTVTEKTEIPIKFAKTILLSPKNGIWLALEKRQKC